MLRVVRSASRSHSRSHWRSVAPKGVARRDSIAPGCGSVGAVTWDRLGRDTQQAIRLAESSSPWFCVDAVMSVASSPTATRLWRDNDCRMRYSSGGILGYAVLTLALQINGKINNFFSFLLIQSCILNLVWKLDRLSTIKTNKNKQTKRTKHTNNNKQNSFWMMNFIAYFLLFVFFVYFVVYLLIVCLHQRKTSLWFEKFVWMFIYVFCLFGFDFVYIIFLVLEREEVWKLMTKVCLVKIANRREIRTGSW